MACGVGLCGGQRPGSGFQPVEYRLQTPPGQAAFLCSSGHVCACLNVYVWQKERVTVTHTHTHTASRAFSLQRQKCPETGKGDEEARISQGFKDMVIKR